MIEELFAKGTGILGVQMLIAAFWAILFLQSGIDKLVDWTGNLSWLNGHFSNTFFKNKVKLMLTFVTALELAAGVISLIGVFALWFGNDPYWAYMGAFISAKVLLILFLGQRLAKEYAGASTLAIYFGVALISLYLLH
jgi:putative oxidoreductase